MIRLFFGTSLGLYKTDGTANGTSQLSNIMPQLYGSTSVFQGNLYFQGLDTMHHYYRLYSTNSKIAGTGVVHDISSYRPYNPSQLVAGGSILYFTANQTTYGTELWKVTGTMPPRASLVKNINQGIPNSYLRELVVTGNEAYFLFNGKLWKSNGTDEGTQKINNISLSDLSYIDDLTAVGNKLFFVGGSSTYGDEIYVNEEAADKSNIVNNAVAKTITKTSLSAQLATNPFYSDLKINITSPQKQQLTITVSNSAGQKIISKIISANEGTNAVSFGSAQWQNGMYIISVSSNTETISLKAIK